MSTAVLVEQILHVFEEFDMPALIGGNGDALYIFFDRTFDDLGDAPVVPQMNDLRSLGLQDPAHDIDGGIMPVEQCCGRDQADLMYRGVAHGIKVIKKLANVS